MDCIVCGDRIRVWRGALVARWQWGGTVDLGCHASLAAFACRVLLPIAVLLVFRPPCRCQAARRDHCARCGRRALALARSCQCYAHVRVTWGRAREMVRSVSRTCLYFSLREGSYKLGVPRQTEEDAGRRTEGRVGKTGWGRRAETRGQLGRGHGITTRGGGHDTMVDQRVVDCARERRHTTRTEKQTESHEAK